MSTSDRLPPLSPAVVRAMARWPDVPRCHGWLGLDQRGAWRIQGATVTHRGTVQFLGRHYRPAADGSWYVQNGPQQVFVDLAYTPWIYRYDARDGFATHTGLACPAIERALIDEHGHLLLETAFGIGVVDDRDLLACAALLTPPDSAEPDCFHWGGQALAIERIARRDVAARFAFVAQPRDA